MLKDVQNSIKAKLYDFTYSPFMSSMIISWIIINHKYILIYMASYDLEKKLSCLNKYDFTLDISWFSIPYFFNIVLPILFGLFYTFLYPLISRCFYEITLKYQKKLKEIKQKNEDITPLTQEEAQAYRDGNKKLLRQIEELEIELSKKYSSEELISIEKRILFRLVKASGDGEIKFLRYLCKQRMTSDSGSSFKRFSKDYISKFDSSSLIEYFKKEGILVEQNSDFTLGINGFKLLDGLCKE